MELTMCEALAGYGEILPGDQRAKTGIVLLQSPSPRLAEEAFLRSAGRWVLKLDCKPAQQGLYRVLAERLEADGLSSLAIVGHTTTESLRKLAGVDLAVRVAKRNEILSDAQDQTIQMAEQISEYFAPLSASGRKLEVVTLFYHDDSGLLQIYDAANNSWKAVPSAPAY